MSVKGEGYSTYDKNANANKNYNGTAWVLMGGAADHNTLSNLTTGDVHTQYTLIASGAAAPATTPGRVGLVYIETTTPDVYFSTGTATSADWQVQINHLSTLDQSTMTIDGGLIV